MNRHKEKWTSYVQAHRVKRKVQRNSTHYASHYILLFLEPIGRHIHETATTGGSSMDIAGAVCIIG
jgi:hypothetical protein